MGLPAYLQSCLWSYDVSRMDKDRDWWVIINQVLNWGNKQQVEWVKQNYPREKIEEVVRHPRRGMWFRERLRWWLRAFDIMIDPLEFEAAVIELNRPRLQVMQAWFDRKGVTSK